MLPDRGSSNGPTIAFSKHPPKVASRTQRCKDCLKPGIAAPPVSCRMLETAGPLLNKARRSMPWLA